MIMVATRSLLAWSGLAWATTTIRAIATNSQASLEYFGLYQYMYSEWSRCRRRLHRRWYAFFGSRTVIAIRLTAFGIM